jgi:ABC-2 type transport system ATP-binding protein
MIHIAGLSKSYDTKPVLDSVDLRIEAGSCYGLLGNNGAGKSTLINILLDLVPPSRGFVEIDHLRYPADTLAIRARMGVLPEKDPIHPELTAYEQLQMSAMLYGIPVSERDSRIRSLFGYFFDSEEDLDKRCGSFSTGMRKKVGIIAALLHKPDVVILDEPFSGLDPGSAIILIDFLKNYLNARRAALISSHNLNYVEQLATHIVVLHERKILYNGSKDEFLQRGSGLIDRTLFDMLYQTPRSSEKLGWLLQD